ncbi:conserved domain protein [delta proteobacterium NaphS2]|nr:conserved domain protein [delta proteobacterium NaphS2]
MKRIHLFFFMFFILTVPGTFSLGAEPQWETKGAIENLERLVQSMSNLSRMISATREVMKGPNGIGREKELKARLDELQMKLQVMEGSFERLSAGIGLDALHKEKEAEVDWNRELAEFLSPIMSEIKKMTSRPRKIEALRNEIAQYDAQLRLAQGAQKRLITLVSETSNPQLIEKLGKLTRSWENQENEIKTRMAVSENALEKAVGEKKSIGRSFQDLLAFFFSKQGQKFVSGASGVRRYLGLPPLSAQTHFSPEPLSQKGKVFRGADFRPVLPRVYGGYLGFCAAGNPLLSGRLAAPFPGNHFCDGDRLGFQAGLSPILEPDSPHAQFRCRSRRRSGGL